ncbi:hypothetical protein QQF64_019808 [Cirrhinus molitorella]|uniref:Uncharacterized protein n=1 Tax=Cirrhinus molitorella TaxID=172907 RepID=A0ABR3LK61_9TELE
MLEYERWMWMERPALSGCRGKSAFSPTLIMTEAADEELLMLLDAGLYDLHTRMYAAIFDLENSMRGARDRAAV